ncbi:hypothetical protein C4Y11_26610 [Escherichia coli]|nr:hypothetical protein C4Y11_26610 [Escherichia coli]
MTDFGGKTSIFSHPVYLFLRKFSLQDFRGGSVISGHDKPQPPGCLLDRYRPLRSNRFNPKNFTFP